MVNLHDLRGLQERLVVDTSESQPSYLLIGSHGTYIKLSPPAYHLLRNVGAGVSFEALAERMSQQQGRNVYPSEVETAFQHVMSHIEAIERKQKQNPTGFWFRIGLMPAALVAWITRLFALAYHPVVAGLLLAGMIASILLWHGDIVAPIFFAEAGLISVSVLFLVSMIFHELGHASACARFGLRPSEIGFALYWIYPVFYSNVNAVWRLPRWKRVIVDLGGVYFQFVVGAAYLALYQLTGWEPLKISIGVILYSCLFTLNPILKFDGYWVIADALGVVNLWRQPGRVFRHLLDRWRGRPTQPLPWSPWISAVMLVYTVASVTFWVYFTFLVVRTIWSIGNNYPFVFTWAIQSAINPPHELSPLGFLLFPTFTLLASFLTIVFVARRLLNAARPLLRRLLGRTASPQTLANPPK
ncbi:MAG TPA: hypothetical protein VFS21_22020 [Roseiflexaceae bacterium]|nr:hypothetical protein [Roseiflexaceae bacterium]